MKSIYPNQIPIFPLSGVIYFPKTNLPLNIFEERYRNLVNDSIKNNKLMGMIQTKKNSNEVYKIGCLGKISDFKKNKNGTILINLTGLIRFEIVTELKNKKLYREFEVDYKNFEEDVEKRIESSPSSELFNLFEKTERFFKRKGLLLNWNEFKKLEIEQQINTISMIAPISIEEKQKLLETKTVENKSKILSEIIEFYNYENNLNRNTIQ
ncbi:MAG: LON peptidase substrate-binding domain-containing protein [Pelagibacteraceae bacterium]